MNTTLSTSPRHNWTDISTTAVAGIILAVRRHAPLLISLWILMEIMQGVTGNWTAQWLLALIISHPLSGWLVRHAERYAP